MNCDNEARCTFKMHARVLLVEDEETVGLTLSEDLLAAGFSVDWEKDGGRAWTAFKANRYDVVVTDIRLPGVDGLELLRRIIAAAHGTPVIVMTSYVTVESALQAIRSGAQDYIQKPFYNADMVSRVQLAYRTQHLSRQGAAFERLLQAQWEELSSQRISGQQKGLLLESFVRLLLSTVPGLVCSAERAHSASDEIDVVFRNESEGAFWRKVKAILLVECKHTVAKRRPGRAEIDAFAAKMQRRRAVCSLGIFVSYSGVSRGARAEALRLAGEDICVIVLDRSGLLALLCSVQRNETLKSIVAAQLAGSD